MTNQAPPGFQPRSGTRPLWLHTIEFDPDSRLVAVIMCAEMKYLNNILGLIDVPAGQQRIDMIVHQTDNEVWLRLNRDQALALRYRLGKLNEQTSPFGRYSYQAYTSLVEVENITYHEDED
jgi:hypothetical protein